MKHWHGFAMPFTFTPPLRLWHSTMSPNFVRVANQLLQLKIIHTGPNASKVSPDDAAGLDPVVCIAHCARVMLWSLTGQRSHGKSNSHLLQKRPSTTQLAIFCYFRVVRPLRPLKCESAMGARGHAPPGKFLKLGTLRSLLRPFVGQKVTRISHL